MHSFPGLFQGLRPPGQTVGVEVHAEAGLWDLSSQMGGPAAHTAYSQGQIQWLALPYLSCRQWLGTRQPTVPPAVRHRSTAFGSPSKLQTLAGLIQPIRRLDGSAAPPCHQHADDTTLHLRTREDLQAALETSTHSFCSASGSSLNAGKSQALMLGGDDFHGLLSGSGITFVQRGESVRHLGTRITTEPHTAALKTYTAILGAVRQAASHWLSRQLTTIGRVHVAKQVLASKVTYHATFIPIPPPWPRS